ncbi:unnamed protein product [Closterium sp. Naga37s-1]|nr:unnamed protein product [Closterium sp. Naga37s-1]
MRRTRRQVRQAVIEREEEEEEQGWMSVCGSGWQQATFESTQKSTLPPPPGWMSVCGSGWQQAWRGAMQCAAHQGHGDSDPEDVCGQPVASVGQCVGRPAAATTIVHSHDDFSLNLSPYKALWDPKDDAERVVVRGRYKRDYSRVALHPIDFLDASSGALLGSAIPPLLTTISPVNLPHPRCDLLATGSSR